MSRLTPDQQVERDKKRLAFEELCRDYAETFKTKHGKRVLFDLMAKGFFWETTFTGNSKGMFLEGKREFVLEIIRMVAKREPSILPDIYTMKIQKMKENANGNG